MSVTYVLNEEMCIKNSRIPDADREAYLQDKNFKDLIDYGIIALFDGIIASLLGIGGWDIMVPLLLHMRLTPEAS